MPNRSSSLASLRHSLWGEERPFYWILTVAMIIIYGSAVVGLGPLRAPAHLVPFTLLMIIHTALHWLSARMAKPAWRRWRTGYVAGQAALAFILNLMAPGVGLLLGLYMALIGETFGIYAETNWKWLAILGYMGLSIINYLVFSTWRDLVWWALAFLPMTAFVTVYVSVYTQQTQARHQAQALSRQLEAANRQLTEYAAQVEDLTRAAERQRMARELHDTLAQGLAGLILQLEAVNSHLANGKPERAQAIVQQAMSRARTTLADARRAIDDLRAEAAAADLAAAVQAEADRFTAATGLPCEVAQALPEPLSEGAREQALRAVAEALTNVARHAQAGHVWVRLAGEAEGLTVEVRDDGCGFDPGLIAAGHYGLLGLRERARLAGGTLEIASAPRQGTTLRLWLPAGEAPAATPAGGAAL